MDLDPSFVFPYRISIYLEYDKATSAMNSKLFANGRRLISIQAIKIKWAYLEPQITRTKSSSKARVKYQKIPKPEGLVARSKYRYLLENIIYCTVWIALIFKKRLAKT